MRYRLERGPSGIEAIEPDLDHEEAEAEEDETMNTTAQRIAIHRALGHSVMELEEALERFKDRDGYPDAIFQLARIPDYPSDLNAMHGAEVILTGVQLVKYRRSLRQVIWNAGEDGDEDINIIRATAAQRAEAFLRTLNLWTT